MAQREMESTLRSGFQEQTGGGAGATPGGGAAVFELSRSHAAGGGKK
jgi:hypothetical protein